MKSEIKNFNKLVFKRLILLLIFMSILLTLIPILFNFEKYYGLSRFINQGFVEIYLSSRLELYLTLFMSFFSLTSIFLIYFFVPIGKFFFLIYMILNFIIIMISGDIIYYGILFPINWIKNVCEALILYFMFFGPYKKYFETKI
jgi:hypothetical protein